MHVTQDKCVHLPKRIFAGKTPSKRPRVYNATEATDTIAQRITTSIKCRERERERISGSENGKRKRTALRRDSILDKKRKHTPARWFLVSLINQERCNRRLQASKSSRYDLRSLKRNFTYHVSISTFIILRKANLILIAFINLNRNLI